MVQMRDDGVVLESRKKSAQKDRFNIFILHNLYSPHVAY